MIQMNVKKAVQEAPTRTKLKVENLGFYYDNFQALHDINLELAENRVTAFIGASGCGKSTLLRTFNRIYSLYPEQRATGQILLRSEEHTSELQSRPHLVCRLLLE